MSGRLAGKVALVTGTGGGITETTTVSLTVSTSTEGSITPPLRAWARPAPRNGDWPPPGDHS